MSSKENITERSFDHLSDHMYMSLVIYVQCIFKIYPQIDFLGIFPIKQAR